MRRTATLFFTLWAMLAVGAADAGPVLLFDAKTGNVLYAREAMAPWAPASLTKLMTAYVTFRAIRDERLKEDQRIPCSAEAHAQPPSKLGLPTGATIDVKTALKALIVMSANDVAVMLAEAVSGSVEKFVAEMNAIALELGMTGTYFTNPHGLPAAHQMTTARDIGLLTRALIRDFPEYDGLFGLESIKIGKRTVRSHNKMLGQFNGADGMKTGYICASGYNLVASATRGKRRVVAVVLGAKSGNARRAEAADLLERGFQDAWWKGINPKKLEELSPPYEYGLLPEHMGPVVCRGRYSDGEDAYAVDAKLRAQLEAEKITQIAKAPRLASASTVNPMIDPGPESDVPIPTLRPDR